MQFGLLLPTMRIDNLLSVVATAEAQDFDFVGLGDSQLVFREAYTSLGVVANETDSIEIGPNVTNPITRHPAVTASAICTANEISGGRAVFGIGTGDSAVATLGRSPSRLSEVEETIDLFRTLSRGEQYDDGEADLSINWIEHDEAHDIPVMMAGSGPKSLALAGRTADRVLVGNGHLPDVLEQVNEQIEAGARDAGRDPDDIDTWVYARANIGDNYGTAIAEIRSVLASAANQGFAFSTNQQQIPEEHAGAIDELQKRYDADSHVGTGDDNPNATLVEELGLTEYLADRFAIAGTPNDCIEQLDRLKESGLIDGILFSNVTTQTEQFVARMGEEVLPSVRHNA